jgi:hypothetical protein
MSRAAATSYALSSIVILPTSATATTSSTGRLIGCIAWSISSRSANGLRPAATIFGVSRVFVVPILNVGTTIFVLTLVRGSTSDHPAARSAPCFFVEHLADNVLLDLPYRQFLFTIPNALKLFIATTATTADVFWLIYRLVNDFYDETALGPSRLAW